MKWIMSKIKRIDPLTPEQENIRFNQEHFPDMFIHTEVMTIEKILEKYPHLTEEQIKILKSYKE